MPYNLRKRKRAPVSFGPPFFVNWYNGKSDDAPRCKRFYTQEKALLAALYVLDNKMTSEAEIKWHFFRDSPDKIEINPHDPHEMYVLGCWTKVRPDDISDENFNKAWVEVIVY